ncbi:GntR family transcriptional regulator [Pantoea sp. App145]|uniref:GntR family transcriptional regulator n=1 Tax=Pantoea sp. App145 TaxID=3071567 RepID=UPI003A80F708
MKSMTVVAYQQMRQNIIDNQWPPGTQATEQELASLLGMSRTPVREALIRLEQEGLLSVIPRHGMRVLPITPADMEEIYIVISSLEATAAELVAARHLEEAELAGLMSSVQEMSDALSQNDLEKWAIADEHFHRQLLNLCGNEMLKNIVLNFWDRAHRARMITLRLRSKPTQSTSEHAELIAALREGNVVQAGKIQKEHRDRARKELLSILHNFKLTNL